MGSFLDRVGMRYGRLEVMEHKGRIIEGSIYGYVSATVVKRR